MMKSNIFHDLDKLIENKIYLYSKDVNIKNIKILLSYSGGVDSSVLLYILNNLSDKLRFQIDFVYINHKMNPNDNLIKIHSKKISKQYQSNFIYREIVN